ncbi:unnamed protein product [Boreogadus saida]
MGRAVGAALFFLTLLNTATSETDYSPPGRPKLSSCLSRDKETFTCWWAPSDRDDALRTTYALYYLKESSDVVYTCPDYRTAGPNSCYFNKNNTSIWVNYNITVAATNARGSNFSEPVVVDVAYIVQPHTPENLTVVVLGDKDGTFFRVSWEPPRKADTRSGWITLIYELRAKLDGADWEEHFAGQQKMFNIFSLRSGGTYRIQVRCKPIHGFWSEWSPTVNVTAPYALPLGSSMWILIAFFSALIFLLLTWILNVKSRSVKHCLFPPVPGPKIRGFDKQLLKNGRSEELFNALGVPGLPPMTHPNYEDLLVYLEVSGRDESELLLADTNDPTIAATTEGGKSPNSPSDSDSGHGSCDSHTLLMEKCGEGEEVKEEQGEEEEEQGDGVAVGRSCGGKQRWERRGSWERNPKGGDDQEMTEGRVKTWPCVFAPPEEYAGSKALDHGSTLGMARLLCSSVHSIPLLLPTPVTSPSGLHAREGLHWQPYSRSESNIQSPEHKHRRQQQGGGKTTTTTMATTTTTLTDVAWPAQPRSPFRATEYVEVQRVNQENMMVLRPLSSAQGQREGAPQGEQDYSRVKGLNSGDGLLLQRAVDAETQEEVEEGQEEEEEYPCDVQEKNSLLGDEHYTAPPAVPGQMTGAGKLSMGLPTAVSLQGDTILAANGYVDTAVAMMPTR